jgi:inner membrane protein
MDNLSHSLVGLALGELVDHALPAEAEPARARLRRRMLLVTGWAASNFPDLDLVLTPLAAPPLGYLLHHRGHTHTLLYALPQALLLLALIWLLWPSARTLLRESRAARRGAALAGALGLVVHLAMDGLNIYGVHPFHPFDSRWLYGDLVFIIEPVLWIALGVPLAALVPARAWRWLLYASLAAAPVTFTALGFLQWGSLAALALVGAGLAWLQRRRGGSAGLGGAIAVIAAFIVLQGATANLARTRVIAELGRVDPGSRVLDVPLSAFPANPVCWAFATVTSNDAADSYQVRRGVLTLLPGLAPVAACPAQLGGAPQANHQALEWVWEERGSISQLRALRRTNCHVDAWLRFARVPSFAGGEATDMRFSRPGFRNFSTLPYAEQAGQPCPDPVPGWGYPRADLLGLE